VKQPSIGRSVIFITCTLSALLSVAFLRPASSTMKIEAKNIRVEFNASMHSRITARFDGKEIVLGEFGPSESITAGGTEMSDFALKDSRQQKVRDELGSGRQVALTGTSGAVQKAKP
jgi:hypothetical protein